MPLRPQAVSFRFKGGFCGLQFAMANPQVTKEVAKRAEDILRKAKTLAPGFVLVQPLLARALQLQGRFAEALVELEEMLSLADLDDDADQGQKDVVADGLRCLGDVLAALGRQGELAGYSARFTAKYGFLHFLCLLVVVFVCD